MVIYRLRLQISRLSNTSNQLSGSIPSGLLKRVQDGSLILRYDNNPNLCANGNSCQPAKTTRSNMLVIYIVVPVAVILVIALVVLLFCFVRRKKPGSVSNSVKPQNEMATSYAIVNNVCGDGSLRLKSRRFTYKELQMITNNFQRVLGRGGFGYVYDGFLEDGTQVAVKLRSHSSNQGVKEFLAEAKILSRIHHKNLVSMIGYCKDGEYMALVYEYTSEGTLQEHIEGLEYLHKGCYPPLIHRDVKVTNILLNAQMEARISDFGLSKAFSNDNETHVSTNTLVGTPGYVDPEYQAQNLSRIHHKNLVSMIGYGKDGEYMYMPLIYEYMSEGTLQEHIEGSNRNGACLTWTQRLRIALESAQGLEYLHKGCYPPLIHIDVKATNILLNAKMEARIADFGLSKAFSNDNETHVSMNIFVGTPGYVDPEYQATMQPTAKSDVYSFGVVLLELVTGKPAILQVAVPVNIIQWVRQRLARANIEGVVDERMRGGYDVNGVWKVADIALKCTAQASVQRPTMTDVVAQLQECVELENGRVGGNTNNGFHIGSSGDDPNLSYDAYTTGTAER
ncbi:receptor-like protein kinase At3g21340 [Triticum dicoccoides]|uniref:receptor-like protein kinase At3g21340 n=1 Tax=Triticum dicoccoides TaxID=85692 RepID=UPI00188F321C|nr:receptor-like protein kinase At3g21340 [Triticum dicoccoides]